MRALAVLLVLLLTACAPEGGGTDVPGQSLTRYVDEEYQIVCYQRYASNAALACASYDR